MNVLKTKLNDYERKINQAPEDMEIEREKTLLKETGEKNGNTLLNYWTKTVSSTSNNKLKNESNEINFNKKTRSQDSLGRNQI